ADPAPSAAAQPARGLGVDARRADDARATDGEQHRAVSRLHEAGHKIERAQFVLRAAVVSHRGSLVRRAPGRSCRSSERHTTLEPSYDVSARTWSSATPSVRTLEIGSCRKRRPTAANDSASAVHAKRYEPRRPGSPWKRLRDHEAPDSSP